ncbi:MAG TPA: PIN domain-containing protein [Actinomycetes bacterium]|nr:PIN domain-containing protein [Actinomycetes bacterium]
MGTTINIDDALLAEAKQAAARTGRSLTAVVEDALLSTGLCRTAGVKGNLVPDAYLAALAIESGSEWITTDRDFSRFPGPRWRHPLS